ncbi:tetratricopeptide repeat protein [Denitratisoma oestradiolicum]|uniref:Uncharacterized protein n=1 Tax=Denitratisoma oestradiolicum TaxID=311182 RepID=A0A6S6Y3Q7_9PROT|nr:tetratricopeptide repeat protein [Denitratisoma oestradiolicum]TWO79098.1 hypothetical protein CBW56_16630 [Denitratisoma oestradiolicum]CAB1369910.1 conserved exported protein of unknown function [Denitratisoma oestradiolicum]
MKRTIAVMGWMFTPLALLVSQGGHSASAAEDRESMNPPRMIALPTDSAPSSPDQAALGEPAPSSDTDRAIIPRQKREAGSRQPSTSPGKKNIQITRTRPHLDPTLTEAYEALQQGNLAQAAETYQRALAHDPWNGDALHGMAVLHLRQGRPDMAEPFYQKALEADPRDARALAGLINLQSPADPVQAESRLNSLLARMPESPFLNFSRGNLLAEQGRWSEARQAYSRAASRDPANPDYLFNLAVSLDRLQQPVPAARYYQQALAEAGRCPAGFDRLAAMERLKRIRP